MLSPIPRRRKWVPALLSSPSLPAFLVRATESACTTTFSRIAQRSLALRPVHSPSHQIVTFYTRGFSHFVTSMTAPIASGWSKSCRVGHSPTGITSPFYGAHPLRSFEPHSVGRTGISLRLKFRFWCRTTIFAFPDRKPCSQLVDERHSNEGYHGIP